jgi:hypothetical protein
MKSRIEILSSATYLNRSEISIMLQCSRQVANRIYAEADRIDNEELKLRAYPSKVRKASVEQVAGVSCLKLLKELKNAEGLAHQSAISK